MHYNKFHPGLIFLIAGLLVFVLFSPTKATASSCYIDDFLATKLFLPGDINNDGTVDNTDLIALNNILANGYTPDGYNPADVNGDGETSADDATYLNYYLAGTGPAPCTENVQYCTASPCYVNIKGAVIKLTAQPVAVKSDTEVVWQAKAYKISPNNVVTQIALIDLDITYFEETTSFTLGFERDDSPHGLPDIPYTVVQNSISTPYTDTGAIGKIDTMTLLMELTELVTANVIDKDTAVFPHSPQQCSAPVNMPTYALTNLQKNCCVFRDFCYQRGGNEEQKNNCDKGLLECLQIGMSDGYWCGAWAYRKDYLWNFLNALATPAFRYHNEDWFCNFRFKDAASDALLDNGTLIQACGACEGQSYCNQTCVINTDEELLEYPCISLSALKNEIPPTTNFNNYTIDPYDPAQDINSTIAVFHDGLTLKVSGNAWKKIDYPCTITPNTVLSFYFKSTVKGEIQGIGMDTDMTVDSDLTFKLYGSQSWGNTTYANYSSLGTYQAYTIPIGKYYTGETKYLFFANDDDASSLATSYFSNIRIYEDVPDATAPSAVTNLNAVGGSGKVELVWSAPDDGGSDITSYKVQYGTVASGLFGTTVTDNATPGITINSLTNGTAYQFRVYAVNAVGTSAASDTATATPTSVPSAVTNLSASAGSGKVTLAWSAPSNGGSAITKYKVQYGTVSSGAFAATVYDNATPGITISSLTNGTAYQFRVYAVNAIGTSTVSNTAKATPKSVPSAVTNLRATAGTGSVTLSWSAPSNGGSAITKYKVQYGTVSSGAFATTVYDDATPGITISSLTNGTAYQFRVYAVNAVGTSAVSNTATATPKVPGQTPWKTIFTNNNYGLYTMTDTNTYTAGYRFKPLKNGKVVKLGGYFNGTGVVKIWETYTNTLLASVTVTGQNGQWVYADIPPVSVTAGTNYTVAVYINEADSTYAGYISSIPDSGDIEITSAMRGYGNGIPTIFIGGWMYGMADIMFEAD